METLRILWLNWRCIRHPRAGGAEVYTHEIARRLASWGHEIVLATSRPRGHPRREHIDGYTVIRRGGTLTVYPGAMYTYLKLRRGGFRPDVVIDEVNTIPFMTPLYVKEPIVMLIHQLCKDCWGPAVHPLLQAAGWLLERSLHRVYVRSAKKDRLRKVITVSESTLWDLVSLGYPKGIVRIVYNALDPDRYPTNACRRDKEKLAVYLGRLSRYKRVEDLLKAWRIVEEHDKEARLLVAGRPDPGYLSLLRRLLERLSLKRAIIRGEVSEEEKREILARAMLLVYTSQREGWGRTVMEAGACYTPTVAYNVPGLRDSIVHGKTGLLVEPGNIEALASSILKLLSDPDLVRRMGAAARERALRFTWDDTAKAFLGELEEI